MSKKTRHHKIFDALNQLFVELSQSGKIKEIYQDYHLNIE